MAGLSDAKLRDYGILALPLAVVGLPLYLHAPDFYVTEKALSLSSIGVVLLFTRVFDAFQDPLIGALSDKYPNFRRLAMLVALAALGTGMLALFSPPAHAGLAWFAFWVILATSSYSVVTINLNTIGGIWSSDEYERTRIASTRERFGLVGVSLGVLVPGVLMIYYGKATGFATFAIGLLLVLLFCGFRFWKWSLAHSDIVSGRQGNDFPARNRFLLPRDARIWRLVIVTFVGFFASALPAVLFLFFVRDNIQRESLAWLFLLLYFAAAIAGVPVWRNLSRDSGKIKAWCFSIVMAVLAFTGAAFTGQNDLLLYGIVCLVTGFALGGDLVFPASIMADLTGRDADAKAHATAGYAWLSFSQKAALGTAAGVAFPVLGWAGFQSGGVNGVKAMSKWWSERCQSNEYAHSALCTDTLDIKTSRCAAVVEMARTL
jgi:Na+/melibiose symporter-like transporter